MKEATLERFRKTLFDRRRQLTEDVHQLEEAIRDEQRTEGESNVRTHPADQDSEGVGVDVELSKRENQMLQAIEDALQRTEDGTYGVCQDCGITIEERRLEAIPYTRYCIDCAEKHKEGIA